MNFVLLQWNIHGLVNNYPGLQFLIRGLSPSFLPCAYNFTPILPKSYSVYFTNSTQNNTTKQGTGIFIKSDIPHKEITNKIKTNN